MKELLLPPNPNKELVMSTVEEYLGSMSLAISRVDNTKPWGGEFYIDESQADAFIAEFFPEVNKDEVYQFGTELSPKILMVGPDGKLSWQYHDRRAEIWKALTRVGIKDSQTDEEPEEHRVLEPGEIVSHGTQVRHTLMGVGEWGVIAEIWQHTAAGNPSDQHDIHRLKDFYGRAGTN